MPSHLQNLNIGRSFANALWLPPTLEKLVLYSSINAISIMNSFPESLHRVKLRFQSDQPLPVGILPKSLKELIVSQPVQIGSIPDGVTDLTYDCNHTIPIDAVPSTVQQLCFGDNFNQPIPTGVIPASVTRLKFGDTFNQLFFPGSISNSVTHVKFGKDVNHLLMPGALPESVTHLVMHREKGVFNQPLAVASVPLPRPYALETPLTLGSIPRYLTHLIFSSDYNQPLYASALPDSITHLAFGQHFSQLMTNGALPRSLQHLHLSDTGPSIDTEHVKSVTALSPAEQDLNWW